MSWWKKAQEIGGTALRWAAAGIGASGGSPVAGGAAIDMESAETGSGTGRLVGNTVRAAADAHHAAEDLPVVGPVYDMSTDALVAGLETAHKVYSATARSLTTAFTLSATAQAYAQSGNLPRKEDAAWATLDVKEAWGNSEYVSPGQMFIAGAWGDQADNPDSPYAQVNRAITEQERLDSFKNNWIANAWSGATDATLAWFLDPLVVGGKAVAATKLARNVETRATALAKVDETTGLFHEGTGLSEFAKWAAENDSVAIFERLGRKESALAGLLGEADSVERSTLYLRAYFGDEHAIAELEQTAASAARAIKAQQDFLGFAVDAGKGATKPADPALRREIRDLIKKDERLAAALNKGDEVEAVRRAQLEAEQTRLRRRLGELQEQEKVTEEVAASIRRLREEEAQVTRALTEIVGAAGADGLRIARDSKWAPIGLMGTLDSAGRERIALRRAEKRVARKFGEKPVRESEPETRFGAWVHQRFQRAAGIRPVNVWTWMGKEKPTGHVALDGPDVDSGARDILATLDNSAARDILGPEEARAFANRFLSAGTNSQRYKVIQDMEREVVARMGAQHGMSPDEVEAFYAKFALKREEALRNFRENKGMFVDDAGELHTAAMTEAELANHMTVMDFDTLKHYLERRKSITRGVKHREDVKWTVGDIGGEAHDLFSTIWRPSVLLRFAYMPRNTGEGLLRSAATLDGYLSAERIVNSIAKVDSPLRNVARNRSEGFFARLVTGRTKEDIEDELRYRLMGKQGKLEELQAQSVRLTNDADRADLARQMGELRDEIETLAARLDTGKWRTGVIEQEYRGVRFEGAMRHQRNRNITSAATTQQQVRAGAGRRAAARRRWYTETVERTVVEPTDLQHFPAALALEVNERLRNTWIGQRLLSGKSVEETADELWEGWLRGDQHASYVVNELNLLSKQHVIDTVASAAARIESAMPDDQLLAIARVRDITAEDVEAAMIRTGALRLDDDIDLDEIKRRYGLTPEEVEEARGALPEFAPGGDPEAALTQKRLQEITKTRAALEKRRQQLEDQLDELDVDEAIAWESAARAAEEREPLLLVEEALELANTLGAADPVGARVLGKVAERAARTIENAQDDLAEVTRRLEPPSAVPYPARSRAAAEKRLARRASQVRALSNRRRGLASNAATRRSELADSVDIEWTVQGSGRSATHVADVDGRLYVMDGGGTGRNRWTVSAEPVDDAAPAPRPGGRGEAVDGEAADAATRAPETASFPTRAEAEEWVRQQAVDAMRDPRLVKAEAQLAKTEERLLSWRADLARQREEHRRRLAEAEPKELTDAQRARLEKRRERLQQRIAKAEELLVDAEQRAVKRYGEGVKRMTRPGERVRLRQVDRDAKRADLEEKLAEVEAALDDLSLKRRNRPAHQLVPNRVWRPTIGTRIEPAPVKSGIGTSWDRATSVGFHYLGTLPDDVLIRHPFVDIRYKAHMKEQIDAALDQGVRELSPKRVAQMQRIAMRKATVDLKETIYTIDRYSNLATMMRFIAPFFAAQENTYRVWGRIIREDPSVLARGIMGWQAPMRSGWLEDREGNRLEWKPGQFPPGDAMLTWVFPKAAEPLLGDMRKLGMRQKGLNVIVQGDHLFDPGFGPTVQVPVSRLLGEHPDNDLVQVIAGITGQSGRGKNSLVEAAMQSLPPTWMRRVVSADGDSVDSASVAHLMYLAEMNRWEREGRRGRPPTPESVLQKTKGLFLFRAALAAVLPASSELKLTPEAQFYANKVKEYREAGTVDGMSPDERFVEDFPEFWEYLASLGRNHGVVPTEEAFKLKDEFGHLVDATRADDVGMLGALLNQTDTQFDGDVYRAMQGQIITPGYSDRFFDTKGIGESYEEAQAAQGWREYSKIAEQVQVRLDEAGVSIRSDEAAPLREWRDAWIDKLREKYPAWGRDFDVRDSGKMQRRVDLLTTWLLDEKFNEKFGATPRWQAVRTYLERRQSLMDELAARKAAGYAGTIEAASNTDLRDWFASWVEALKSEEPEFAVFYSRYLDGDIVRLG